MAYQVNRYNGSFLVSVADGTIDNTTSIRFVGKNYAGYGQVQNENFLHLMENFAGASQPTKPVSGQLWYDSTDRKIKVYDGTRFRIVGGSTASATAPLGLSAGEFWFDSLAQQLYCWTGSEFILVGPQNSTTLGETTITASTVKDSGNENRTIARIKAGGTDVAIFSKDTFVLSDADKALIPNFGRIKKGITLVGTDNNEGVTTSASSAAIWGTSSSTKSIVDPTDDTLVYTVDDLVLKASPSFPTVVDFSSDGVTFSAASAVKASVALDNAADIAITNQSGNNIKLKIRVSSTETRTMANISTTGIVPGVDSEYLLGSDTLRWYQVWADNIVVTENILGTLIGNVTGNLTGNVVGNVTGNVTGNVSGSSSSCTGNAATATTTNNLNNKGESITAVANTIASRDGNGDITANRFLGTASQSDRLKIDNDAVDNVSSAYKSAKTSKTANTIAARDSSGNLSANIFNGTATSVQGADLAEKYLADKEYPVGTVMIIGGEAEVTASVWVGQRAIGVVSDKPGIIMNEDLKGGTQVALKGRVPVKVIGQVKKGERLVAAPDGCAMAVEGTNPDTFAVALETNLNTEIKFIEALVL
jgi:hypothetical protein